MKIRTENELFDKIAEDISWRKKEIIDYNSMVALSRGKVIERTILRGAVPLFYAHWEGFVKNVALYYWIYVATKKLSNNVLADNFIAFYLKEKILSQKKEINLDVGISLYNFFLKDFTEPSNLHAIKEPIDTRSNLNSLVLKEIIGILGLRYATFEAFNNFIDINLLKQRNSIAHGEFEVITFELYSDIHKNVIFLLDAFKDEIENAAVLKNYKKTP